MASYAVASGEVAAYGKTLVASTVDTVTFTGVDKNTVRVHNDNGSASIFYTVDGSTPTVNGAATYRVPAVAGAYSEVDVPTSGQTVVKLISSGTPTYSVVGG
jgi:hypothetical protein